MIAEIYHKISSSGSNLTERLEDELTGNFFGNLRYLPFNRGLKQILVNQVESELNIVNRTIMNTEDGEWEVEFWKRSDMGLGEIDAFIELDTAVIGIEVKLHSGLSTEDQLKRESEMLIEWGGNKKKILLFIADELECKRIYRSNKTIINQEVLFGYMSWQKAFEGLPRVISTGYYEKKIISDLEDLLKMKGFERFTGFHNDSEEIEDGYWVFSAEVEEKFDFIEMKEIGDVSYEFR